MGLTMRERHAVIRELAPRFRKATKKQRGQMLTEVVELTGYTRCYAAFVLRTCGRKQVRMVGGMRVVFVPAHARQRGSPRARRGAYRVAAFLKALQDLWALSDGLCGKRLVEADYVAHERPVESDLEFWLRESRTPSMLIALAQSRPKLAEAMSSARPVLASALVEDPKGSEAGLWEEERKADRTYWEPLRRELEALRHGGYSVEEEV